MIIMDFTGDLWVKCVFFHLDLGLCRYVFIPRDLLRVLSRYFSQCTTVTFHENHMMNNIVRRHTKPGAKFCVQNLH